MTDKKCHSFKTQTKIRLQLVRIARKLRIRRNFFIFGLVDVCSPDKTDTCSISNPKVNRILNNIAIRAISSFLFGEIFHNQFSHICLYTHFAFFFFIHFFPLFFFGANNMKSEFLLIWTTLLRIFFAMRKYKRMNEFHPRKRPKICGFLSICPHNTDEWRIGGHIMIVLSTLHLIIALMFLHKINSLRFKYFCFYSYAGS